MSDPKIRRRPDRRVPALIVAIVITALGALGTWWSVTALAAAQPLSGLDGLEGLTWGAAPVVAVAAVAALLGLILIVLALKPGRASVVEMTLPESGRGRTTVVTTRGLGRIAAAEAERTDGTVSARTDAKPGAVRVAVGTVAQSNQDAQRLLAERIRSRFAGLELKRAPRVSVHMHMKEKR